MLSAGLIGLPNVGKSSLFNLLTGAGAEVSNYPFTTIDRQLGVVTVPDDRLEALAALLQVGDVVHATLQFTDIAGLVEGASQGEGLGNQFLAHIREVDAVVHVLRCFRDDGVAHVFGGVDPVRDARVIETELILADLEWLAKRIEGRRRVWKTHPKETEAEEARLQELLTLLETGRPPRAASVDPELREVARRLGLLSARPVLYVANIDEAPPSLEELERALGEGVEDAASVVPVAVRWEAELAELDPDDRRAFRRDLGLERNGVAELIEATFDLLGLIRFYTVVNGKLRAWEVPAGTPVQQAAGKIHSDMEEHFIRARVFRVEELIDHESIDALQSSGLMRTEGRDYRVQDGDVIEILF